MTTIEKLTINGYRGEALPHTFFKQKAATSHAAIIFPGWGYTAQMPGLFYPTRLMSLVGADVLQVGYAYNQRTDFQTASGEVRSEWFRADIEAALHALLAQRPYEQITLIGKSLGTRALGHLLTSAKLPPRVSAVWLTPLLKDEQLRGQIQQYAGRSLFVIGTEDPHYIPEYLAEVQRATGGEAILIEGGDHGLNVGSDLLASIRAMERMMTVMQSFVAQ